MSNDRHICFDAVVRGFNMPDCEEGRDDADCTHLDKGGCWGDCPQGKLSPFYSEYEKYIAVQTQPLLDKIAALESQLVDCPACGGFGYYDNDKLCLCCCEKSQGWTPGKLPLGVASEYIRNKFKYITALEKDKAILAEFARYVLSNFAWSWNKLTYGVENKAEILGLISLTTATENDVNEESDFKAGDEIYKLTTILKEPEDE